MMLFILTQWRGIVHLFSLLWFIIGPCFYISHLWGTILGLTRSTLKAALLCGSFLVLGGSQVDSIEMIEIYKFNTYFPHDKKA